MRWDSEIAIKYKRNLLKTLIYRTFKISSGHFLESDLRESKEIFLKSGFPYKFIQNKLTHFLFKKGYRLVELKVHLLKILHLELITLMKIHKNLLKGFRT